MDVIFYAVLIFLCIALFRQLVRIAQAMPAPAGADGDDDDDALFPGFPRGGRQNNGYSQLGGNNNSNSSSGSAAGDGQSYLQPNVGGARQNAGARPAGSGSGGSGSGGSGSGGGGGGGGASGGGGNSGGQGYDFSNAQGYRLGGE